MKKLLIVVSLMFSAGVGFCGQPSSLGNVSVSRVAIDSTTLSAIDTLTPDVTGQLVFCSDCDFKLCIATGADSGRIGAFVVVGGTVPAAASGGGVPMHCQ